MIRTAEYVRGYFDGEGCVTFSTKPTKWGRGAGLVVETTDLDLMRDLVETFLSWGVQASYREHPPRAGANRPTARASVAGRIGIEMVLAKIRPLSEKHEGRLRNVYAFWSAQDQLVRGLALGEELVKAGHTYNEAATIAGVGFKQLANSIAYSKRTGRMRVRPPNLLSTNRPEPSHGTQASPPASS